MAHLPLRFGNDEAKNLPSATPGRNGIGWFEPALTLLEECRSKPAVSSTWDGGIGKSIAIQIPRRVSMSMFKRLAFTLMLTLIVNIAGIAAKHDSKHQDVFIPGDASENRIAREVR